MIVDVVGGILLAGLTLYAALGGADFGGGLWDLLAGGDRRGAAPRQLIDDTITPVWEANHVWLIFVLVIFWTAFPPAFAAPAPPGRAPVLRHGRRRSVTAPPDRCAGLPPPRCRA